MSGVTIPFGGLTHGSKIIASNDAKQNKTEMMAFNNKATTNSVKQQKVDYSEITPESIQEQMAALKAQTPEAAETMGTLALDEGSAFGGAETAGTLAFSAPTAAGSSSAASSGGSSSGGGSSSCAAA